MRLTLPSLVLLGVSLLAAGCDGNEGRTALPNASLQVVHAAPNLGPVVFKRVQANATRLDYMQGAAFSFDVDTYTFNFDILDVDDSVLRTISLPATLVEGSIYFLILREVGGQPEPLLVERPAMTQGAGTELEILHAATTLGAVDVYVDLEPLDLMTATARGAIDFDDVLSVPALADGNYEIVLTDASNQAIVQFQSTPVGLAGSQGLFLAIVDGAGIGLSPLALALGDSDGRTIVDSNSQSGIRVINALSDREAINIGIDDQLTPPLISGVAFATASAFELIAPGDHDLNVEPTLMPGAVDIDQAFVAEAGLFQTWLVAGSTGSMSATSFEDDFRVISGESKLRAFHGSPQNGPVAVFVVPPGTDITSIAPTSLASNGITSPNVRVAPGSYEITVAEQATGAVLAGPIAATIAADGYYGILLTDAAAGTGLEVTLLFDF